MSNSIEMSELHTTKSASVETPLENDRRTSQRAYADDGSVSPWAWTSAVVLALFSTCLLAFPRFLLFLAEPSGGRGDLTSLEKCLALQLGVILGTLAVTIIAMLPSEWPTGLQQRTDPNCHPLLRPVTAACLGMALLSYGNSCPAALTTTVLFGCGAVGLFGLWTLVFSGPPAISRKTGADEHTSSFIFSNKTAASVKKRPWKRDHTK